jgi:uncharacterized protein (DUF342 family)
MMMENHAPDTAVQSIQVTIAPDGLEATAVLLGDAGSCTPEAVREALAAAGVAWGIKDEALSTLVAHPGSTVAVAVGTVPRDGRGGWIEVLVPVYAPDSYGEGASGRFPVVIRNVVKGQQVARVHSPETGTDGRAVTGEVLPARKGTAASVHPMAGVVADDSTDGVYIATRDGNAVVAPDGSIDVQETVTIDGNLDITVGKVEFVGSLIVRGEIRGETSVKVGRNLTVTGDVDDAAIEAGGDVTIKNGFMGRGTGRIRAGGIVKVQHVRNQQIVAQNEVHIERESVNGTIVARRCIVAPRAVIAGGSLEADELVDVGVLGRLEGGQVKVRVGRRGRIVERLAAIEKEARQAEKNLVDVKAAVYKLVRAKIDAGSLPPEREQMLNRLQTTQRQLPRLLEALDAEKNSLTEELQRVADAKLIVRQTISDNVFIEVNGARKFTDTAVEGVMFVERSGELIATGL